MEISNQHNKEFKLTIVKVINEFRRRMNEHRNLTETKKYKEESNRTQAYNN